jgi:hypothetical protein
VGERVSVRDERHYDNRNYEEVPYAAPLALRAVRGSVVRRRNPVVETTDALVDRINKELDGNGRAMAAPAPPEALERPVEDPPEELHALPRRRKLAGVAIEAATDEAA